jgi:hypothetical protein
LWTTGGLEPDAAEEKSLIPCLEPCALLLEFARKALRLEQENEAPPASSRDVKSLEAGLEAALAPPPPGEREADFNSPANPRRLQLAIEKLTGPAANPSADSPP